MKFYKVKGELIEDILQYSIDYLKENPETKIYVGTDSQNFRHSTRFATCICYHKQDSNEQGKGAHVIFCPIKSRKIRDIKERLMKEVEYTMEVVYVLRNMLNQHIETIELSNAVPIEFIDLDINPNENHKSNLVYNEAVGWAKGMGLQVRTKPNAYSASYAADKIAKGS